MGWPIGTKIRALAKGKIGFWCPACQCVHYVYTAEYKLKQGEKQHLWTFNGDGDHPTFFPSINVNANHPESRCHSWVEDGKITFVADSWHRFKGMTIEIPPWPAEDDDDDDDQFAHS